MTTVAVGDPFAGVIYPETDGEPMAENTRQFQWIVKIQGGLDTQFVDNPQVLVVGDLFWYAVQGQPHIRTAPDVMVVFGRPKGHRSSYLQWNEGNIPPQVVFEVLSPSNRAQAMQDKLNFYQQHGVEEYYIYDPDHAELFGWLRSGTLLVPIPNMNGWISPRLNIRFDMSSGDLIIYHPDGRPFATFLETEAQRLQAQEAAEVAEEAARLAEEAAREAEDAARKAQAALEKAQADATKAQDAATAAEKEKREADERAEKLAAQLRVLGIEPTA